jgi:hypothetical protein
MDPGQPLTGANRRTDMGRLRPAVPQAVAVVAATYVAATGQTQQPFLSRWLLLTAASASSTQRDLCWLAGARSTATDGPCVPDVKRRRAV